MFLRLSRFFSATVTRDKLIINFSRSQGPGGQNVNKVNSKADVRFHVDSADWISPEVRERLKTSYAHFINKEGELIVQSQKFREQKLNEEDAIKKIQNIINKAYESPKVREFKEYKESDERKNKRISVKRAKGERESLKKEKFSDFERSNRLF